MPRPRLLQGFAFLLHHPNIPYSVLQIILFILLQIILLQIFYAPPSQYPILGVANTHQTHLQTPCAYVDIKLAQIYNLRKYMYDYLTIQYTAQIRSFTHLCGLLRVTFTIWTSNTNDDIEIWIIQGWRWDCPMIENKWKRTIIEILNCKEFQNSCKLISHYLRNNSEMLSKTENGKIWWALCQITK